MSYTESETKLKTLSFKCHEKSKKPKSKNKLVLFGKFRNPSIVGGWPEELHHWRWALEFYSFSSLLPGLSLLTMGRPGCSSIWMSCHAFSILIDHIHSRNARKNKPFSPNLLLIIVFYQSKRMILRNWHQEGCCYRLNHLTFIPLEYFVEDWNFWLTIWRVLWAELKVSERNMDSVRTWAGCWCNSLWNCELKSTLPMLL